jgi:hypothetical protein
MAITRTAWTDDDGSGTTGTVINNAVKTELYNQIDAALALLLALTGGTVSGATTFSATITFNGKSDHKGEFAISDAGQSIVLASGSNNNITLNAGVTTVTITSAGGGSTLTGLTGGYSGRILIVMNIGSGDTLTIANESASSTDVNRFASAVTLAGGDCATFKYTNRWRRIG